MTVNNKTIGFDKITEITLQRGIIQRMYDLGTLVLGTPATVAENGRAAGVKITDVDNAEELYETLLQLTGLRK